MTPKSKKKSAWEGLKTGTFFNWMILTMYQKTISTLNFSFIQKKQERQWIILSGWPCPLSTHRISSSQGGIEIAFLASWVASLPRTTDFNQKYERGSYKPVPIPPDRLQEVPQVAVRCGPRSSRQTTFSLSPTESFVTKLSRNLAKLLCTARPRTNRVGKMIDFAKNLTWKFLLATEEFCLPASIAWWGWLSWWGNAHRVQEWLLLTAKSAIDRK